MSWVYERRPSTKRPPEIIRAQTIQYAWQQQNTKARGGGVPSSPMSSSSHPSHPSAMSWSRLIDDKSRPGPWRGPAPTAAPDRSRPIMPRQRCMPPWSPDASVRPIRSVPCMGLVLCDGVKQGCRSTRHESSKNTQQKGARLCVRRRLARFASLWRHLYLPRSRFFGICSDLAGFLDLIFFFKKKEAKPLL